MRQEKTFNSLRPYLLSLLFLLYYVGIVLVCWALWRVSSGFDLKSFVENKVLLFFCVTGITSGALLLGTSCIKVELAIKYYWMQRSRQGIAKVLLYLAIQILLFCLPLELLRHGYWLVQQLTLPVLLSGLAVMLIGITYSRFKGITFPGLSVCA